MSVQVVLPGTNPKHHSQQCFLFPRQLQGAQHWYRQTQDQKVCDDIDACHEKIEVRETLLVLMVLRVAWAGGDNGDRKRISRYKARQCVDTGANLVVWIEAIIEC